MNPSHSADSLGRLEDLPADYIANMTALSIAPLWPQLRGLLPSLLFGITRMCGRN